MKIPLHSKALNERYGLITKLYSDPSTLSWAEIEVDPKNVGLWAS
jgi:hypothetical protein